MNSLRPDSSDTGSIFTVRDCALIMVATGHKAQNLRELRSCLDQIPPGSIYHHFWGRLLRAQFDEPEYNNDFASWSYHALHDKILAERLSVVSPTDYPDLDSLRQELIDIVEERLDEGETLLWSQADQQLHFLRGQMVVFDSGLRIGSSADLFPHLNSLSLGSMFYHFIDARSRTLHRCDDFSAWLMGFGDEYADLINSLRNLDPYFSSLKEIRQRVMQIFGAHVSGREP